MTDRKAEGSVVEELRPEDVDLVDLLERVERLEERFARLERVGGAN